MANAHPTEILSLPTESFAEALRRLDPASRALLDLSLRRGMRPEEIADVLGADPDTVVSSRDHALEHVASDLGLEPGESLDELRARLAELPSENWTGVEPAEPEAEPEPSNVVHLPARTPIVEEDLEAAAATPATERTSRAGRLLLLALVVAAAIVAIVVAASGGGSSKKHPAASAPPPSSPKPGPSGGTSARLVAVGPNGAGATGTATVSGGRLHLRITGLPAPQGGAYEVWLYNSVIDALPIGSSTAAPVVIDAKLPQGARHFRSLDISLEPADGNPAHSGNSVMRVRLATLLR